MDQLEQFIMKDNEKTAVRLYHWLCAAAAADMY